MLERATLDMLEKERERNRERERSLKATTKIVIRFRFCAAVRIFPSEIKNYETHIHCRRRRFSRVCAKLNFQTVEVKRKCALFANTTLK